MLLACCLWTSQIQKFKIYKNVFVYVSVIYELHSYFSNDLKFLVITWNQSSLTVQVMKMAKCL